LFVIKHIWFSFTAL